MVVVVVVGSWYQPELGGGDSGARAVTARGALSSGAPPGFPLREVQLCFCSREPFLVHPL